MEKPLYVLILDDEANILSSLKRLFLNEPYDVAVTTHPFEAMNILAKGTVKVVISDQRMPVVTGVQFLKEVKDSYPDIIRILLTGHADVQAAEAAVNVGQVYRFLNKPWNPEELKVAVRQSIELYDLTIERRHFFDELQTKNTELMGAYNKLQQMYDKQKEFTSTVSHELRTPLASIKMALDIVMSGTPGPVTSDQSNFLNKAKSNVDRLNRLINDILDLTKMESGKLEMRMSPGNINKTVLETVDVERPVAEGKGLTLKMDLARDIPEVAYDKDRITQVLLNLMSNAIKFTESGGVTVTTAACPDRNFIQLTVADTGPGIKPGDMEKLFEKFQQLEGAFNNKTGGTGLGLAISRTIVDKHGGKIWAESEYGKGTRFIFILPIVERRKG